MPAKIVFKDDPRIAVHSLWVDEDRTDGITHDSHLDIGVYVSIAFTRREGIAEDKFRISASKLAGIVFWSIKFFLNRGFLVIDQFGAICNATSREEIVQALNKGRFSLLLTYAEKLKDLKIYEGRPEVTALRLLIRLLSGTDPSTSPIPKENDEEEYPLLDQKADDAAAQQNLLDNLRTQFEKWLLESEDGKDLDKIEADGEISLSIVRDVGPQVLPQNGGPIMEIGADPSELPLDSPVFDGRGVIVGAIDYGCDFVHPAFRRLAGGSRIHRLLDQNPTKDSVIGIWPPIPVPGTVGRVFERRAIDCALAATDGPVYVDPANRPYYQLGYHPHDNYFTDKVDGGAHGTHVLDVACGTATAPRAPYAMGVAPGADIVFVQMAKPVVVGNRRVFNPYGVVRGVAYICGAADEAGQPAVVNVSLNGTEGPHDGATPWDRALDSITSVPGRVVVVGAGNFHETETHARDVVKAGSPTRLEWLFASGDISRNELEIWYDLPADGGFLTIVLTSPSGKQYKVRPGWRRALIRKGRIIGRVWNHACDPYPVDPDPVGPGRGVHCVPPRGLILLSLRPQPDDATADGTVAWHLDLTLTDDSGIPRDPPRADVAFHAWISRDDEGQSRFARNSADGAQTLGTMACFSNAITVGAYQTVAGTRSACAFSSAGPTRDNREAPHISAPGRDVWAGRSLGNRIRYPGTGTSWRSAVTMAMSGTSVSAPFVAGTVALMLQRNKNLSAQQIRRILTRTARPYRTPASANTQVPATAAPGGRAAAPAPTPPSWDRQYGFGLLSTAAAVQAVEDAAS